MRSRRSSSGHSDRRPGPSSLGAETRVALGLGSNVGDRLDTLKRVLIPLSHLGDVVARSSVWETAPIGPDQPDYLNAVVVLETVLGPVPLLEHCLLIEQEFGRERRERWGPRIIDIDLLLYADAVLDIPGVTIPHPRMHERRFVLAPLAEVWPDAEVPGHGRVDDLLQSVTDQIVERTDLDW